MSQDEALLRQATPEDSEFAYRTQERAFRVYVEPVFGWDEAFQRKLHEERFSPERYRIIRHSGEDVGILSTSRIDDFLKLNQIFILPEYQSKGLGEAALRIVLQEAQGMGLPVRLRVLKINERAIKFYRKFGFETIDQDENHLTMERS